MMADFHFLRPWWWLALLALPVLWFAVRRDASVTRNWARVIDAHLLPHLMVGDATSRRTPLVVLSIAWLIGVAALAGPAWERLPLPVFRHQQAHVVALQLSATMLAADLKPDRLTRARYKINDLLDRIGDGQVALLGYAGDAFVAAPMTDDANTVKNLLDVLDPSVMPVAGNATGTAIRRALALIEQAGGRGGDIILVADSASNDASEAAREAAERGVRVSVLAVGTAQGAPVSLPQGDFLKDTRGDIVVARLDANALSRVARAGRGNYVEMGSDNRDIDAVLGGRQRVTTGTAAGDGAGATAQAWRDRGPWLALLLLPLALAAFRRGWAFAVLFALGLGAPQPVRALEWRDLWQRADQQAWQALQAGDAKQAQALARDPDLHGSAAFRAGDFATAAQDWQQGANADAAYNRGNALAQQKQFEEAIKAWDEALARDPGHADALANKKSVEEWLKRQQEQQQQQQGGESSRDPSGNEESSESPSSDPSQSGQDKPKETGDPSRQGEPGQSKDGQSGESDSKDGKSEGQQGQSGPSQPGQSGGDARADKDGKEGAGAGAPTEEQARQQAVQAQQDKARFQKEMDKALTQQPAAARGEKGDPKGEPAGKAAVESDAEREQRQANQQWLERVPDDPGALLRRKFQLEYERRKQGGRKDE
ncbi:VWA domain-containing protein [Tahibacter amnicola]|uniref:VWA domain-containing protein n=1 Tax=Tahibacter amnicola TaxID=2976241 RepID=A0ABY6BGN2_9GAMM|nr:VWA domain-containing protein [Tahibacter amnicola]UXI69000.1 VWA domain-containing protein [Tahibacter amnicola]